MTAADGAAVEGDTESRGDEDDAETPTEDDAEIPAEDDAELADAAAVPTGVDSAAGKLVYLALATAGECDVASLGRRLDMRRVTIYGILGTLEARGLVERGEDGYRAAGEEI